jgi:hypothetical protein
MWHAWERRENCTRFWWESPKKRDRSEDGRRRWENGIRIDLREIGWRCGLDSTGSWQGPVVICCGCGDEPSGSCATELVKRYFNTAR